MAPVGDARDLESVQEWELGPPIWGHYGRAIGQMVLWVGVPGFLFFGGFDYYLHAARNPSAIIFGPIALLVGVPLFVGMGWMLVALGNAAMIQVGTKGVAVCQRKFFGGALRRIAWISWEDVRLDIPGAGGKFSRTLHLWPEGQAASVMVVDYEQAKAILNNPHSKATFARYPMWLEKGLGIPRTKVVIRSRNAPLGEEPTSN
jgi:hypothetical protein